MLKPLVRPLESDLVRLRLLEESDLETTLAWRNQDNIRKWFLTSTTLTLEQHRTWFLNYQTRDTDFIFIIESKKHGNLPVGQISFYNIDYATHRGEYGRLMIGNSIAAAQGLAHEATRLILQFAFETIGVEEVYLSVLLNNERAIHLYKACGFLPIGQDDKTLHMSIRSSDFTR